MDIDKLAQEKVFNYKDAMQDLIKRFRIGDSIDDHELRLLSQHYQQLEELLFAEGEKYFLVWKDAADQGRRLRDMYKARKKK
jgi:hypothetical protein